MLRDRYKDRAIDAVVGIESRGFIFSAPLAYRLGVSLVPIRKFGKVPAPQPTRWNIICTMAPIGSRCTGMLYIRARAWSSATT